MTIKQIYYKVKMLNAYPYYNFQDIPAIVKKFGKFDNWNDYTDAELESGAWQEYDRVYVFSNEEDTEYMIFLNNIKISVSLKKKDEYVVRMYIKKECTAWDLRVDGNGKSLDPNNSLEIYLDYNVIVLDDKHCWNTTYQNGAWDEYVYKSVAIIVNAINNLTDVNQFNIAYKGRIKKEKCTICKVEN